MKTYEVFSRRHDSLGFVRGETAEMARVAARSLFAEYSFLREASEPVTLTPPQLLTKRVLIAEINSFFEVRGLTNVPWDRFRQEELVNIYTWIEREAAL